ncbi:MAG: (2Fe-2S)-binding protein, partial [Bradyrhizobium sp.]
HDGFQCGYCTPGQICSAVAVLDEIKAGIPSHGGNLDETTVRQELEGNICRCTGYHNIVKSVLDAAGRMKVSQAAE